MKPKYLQTIVLAIGVLAFVALTGQSCSVLTSNSLQDGGVFRSDDLAESWSQKVFIGTVKKKPVNIDSVNAGTFVFHPEDSDTLYFGTRGNGLYRSEDSGERWQVTGRQSGVILALAIDPEEPEVLYSGNGPHIEKSFDGGVTWDRVYTESRVELSISSIRIVPENPKHIYASNSGGVILESKDRGQTWHVLHIFQTAINRLDIHPADSSILFATLNNNYLSRSSDSGENWTFLRDNLKSYARSNVVKDLAFDPIQASRLYLATEFGLLRSNDLGETWEAVKTLIPNQTLVIRTIDVHPQDSTNLYFTTQNSVHISKDSGETWEVITPPTNRLIILYAIHPDRPEQHFLGTYLLE